MKTEGFQNLVQRAKDGDKKAMDEVLEMLRPQLERMARPYANSARPIESTADLLQEACLRAWRKIGLFQCADNDEETFLLFRAWIEQIVRRLSFTGHRDRGRQRHIPAKKIVRLDGGGPGQTTASGGILIPSRDPSPTEQARTNESAEIVRAAVARIDDETEAEILLLHFGEGLSLLEISRRLEISYKKVLRQHDSALSHVGRDLGDLL
ncbi:MAG: RNA polymerase sigma factor [Planctomycetota bacterium]|nr:RNA polymerase sigma factor [Planctomycetota bacterium]